jgi:hypothetical protein
MYSSYSFTTSALDGGERSASRTGRTLPLGKGRPVPIVQEAGWAPELVWTQRLEERSLASDGDWTLIAQSIARHYTDWATAAPGYFCTRAFSVVECAMHITSMIFEVVIVLKSLDCGLEMSCDTDIVLILRALDTQSHAVELIRRLKSMWVTLNIPGHVLQLSL